MSGEPTITLTGRLGGEPKLNFSQSGKAVAAFSLGVTPSVKENDQWIKKETMWFNISLWKDAEGFVDRAKKGDLLLITGKFDTWEYTTKEGEKKLSLRVNADSVGFIMTNDYKVVVKETQDAEVPW